MIELAWDEEHYNYTMADSDTLDNAAASLASIITTISPTVSASASGAAITLTVKTTAAGYIGANGNRLGVYGTVSGSGGTESWSPVVQQLSGGQSPADWAFSIPFAGLTGWLDGVPQTDANKVSVPTNNVRKMRWTYAADMQTATYQRSEFSVVFTNWLVTGTGLTYSVAGPGSRRIEDTSTALTYSSGWTTGSGNFSGGSIQSTTQPLATCSYSFVAEQAFEVYIGTRMASNCARMTVSIDGVSGPSTQLALPLEDVLVRLSAGTVQPGSHTLVIQHTGGPGTYLYFDFIELVVPSQELPAFTSSLKTTLATDWDTEHSLALAPERTAWLIHTLGFTGRVNHYAGALWFYELVRVGHVYATGTIQFGGHADASMTTRPMSGIGLAGSGQPPNTIQHLHLFGDTIETIAMAFALRINSGYTSLWASASGPTLTLQSRMMGTDGNAITIDATTNSQTMTVVASSSQLTGGLNGEVPARRAGDLYSVASPAISDSPITPSPTKDGART